MRHLKRFFRLLLCTMIATTMFFGLAPIEESYAAYSDFVIKFCNIGRVQYDNETNPYPAVPVAFNETFVTGKMDTDGKAMIRLSDLEVMGAIVYVSGGNWYVAIDGQMITFYEGFTNWTSTISYSIYDPSTGTSTPYSLTVTGNSDKVPQVLGGVEYLRITTAAHQMGALMVAYNSAYNCTEVYDFRIISPITYAQSGYIDPDPNQYIVGGSWVTNWSSMGDTSLAPHFRIVEIWDTSSSDANPTYSKQLKIAVNQLQVAENVRYYYNANSPMNINSGFRSWYKNGTVSNWGASHHMKGRALDIDDWNHAIFDLVRIDFRNGTGSDVKTSIYYRNQDPTLGLSGAYEIEDEANATNYLHLQTKPAYGGNH